MRLLETFSENADHHQSMVHHMFMGAGKTTVVSPLLALFLANGHRIMCACMLAALLDFMCSVFVERFCSLVARAVASLRAHHEATDWNDAKKSSSHAACR